MYLLRLSGKNGRAWRKAFTDSPSIRPHAIRNPMLCVNSDFSTMMVPAGTKKTLVSGETVKPKKQFSLQSWPRTIEKQNYSQVRSSPRYPNGVSRMFTSWSRSRNPCKSKLFFAGLMNVDCPLMKNDHFSDR